MNGVTLAVLAGGRGSRMGMPKAQLVVRGKPILIELIERLRWEGPTLLVTSPGRQQPPGFERLTREVCDPVADEGPVRGLMTAVDNAETETVVVMPVDMPGVERQHLEWVVGGMVERGVMLAIRGIVAPFPSMWHRAIRDDMAAHFQMGGKAMRSLTQIAGVRLVEAPSDWPSHVWQNLNSPADLHGFE